VDWLAYVLLAFFASVLGQMLLLRLRLLGNSFYAFLITGIAIGLGLMPLLFNFYSANIALSGTLLYAFLCELFIFSFTFIYSSVSANLLMRLGHRPMGRAEIDSLYDDRDMTRQRIDGLIHSALVEEAEMTLRITAKGKVLARVFDNARRLFAHE
jgi:hypothetical protein